MRSVLTAVVGALALMATGPAAVGPSPVAGAPRSATGGPAHSPRAEATASTADDLVLRIAQTEAGTFSATYRVGPPPGRLGPTATIAVAQRAAPGQVAWTTRPGEWSYHATSSTGLALDWIESGLRVSWCERRAANRPYVCGGGSNLEASNNSSELTATFLPGTAVIILDDSVISSGPRPRPIVIVQRAVGYGPDAQCLTLKYPELGPYTWCVDGRRLLSAAGVFTGPIAQGTATLTSWSPRAPAVDFTEPTGCPTRCRHVNGLPAW